MGGFHLGPQLPKSHYREGSTQGGWILPDSHPPHHFYPLSPVFTISTICWDVFLKQAVTYMPLKEKCCHVYSIKRKMLSTYSIIKAKCCHIPLKKNAVTYIPSKEKYCHKEGNEIRTEFVFFTMIHFILSLLCVVNL